MLNQQFYVTHDNSYLTVNSRIYSLKTNKEEATKFSSVQEAILAALQLNRFMGDSYAQVHDTLTNYCVWTRNNLQTLKSINNET
jgi:hypothetical protein